MAAAEASNSVSATQTEQLTAPPGWTKKLVPAKGKYVTLRKHDVVFIAPDGKEIPSQWHLRRYLKAHPEGPVFSEFNWSSGEESIRRSARASTKEVSYSVKLTPRRKGKRNAEEMDAEGAEDDGAKTPARKRAKKADEEDSSVVKDKEVLPDKDEVMHELPDEATAGGIVDVNVTALETDAQIDEVDTGTGKVLDNAMEEQVAGENTVNARDGALNEEQKVEEVMEQVVEVNVTDEALYKEQKVEEVMEQVVEVNVTDEALYKEQKVEEVMEQKVEEVMEQVVEVNVTDEALYKEQKIEEVTEQVVEVEEHLVEVKEQVKEAVTTSAELQEEVEPKGVLGVSPFDASSNELRNEEPVVESEKPLEPSDANVVEIKKPLDQNLEIIENVYKITIEKHVTEEDSKGEKVSLEPMMQKEEQERLPSVHNSPHKVENIKEKSLNEMSSSPVPVSVANQ